MKSSGSDILALQYSRPISYFLYALLCAVNIGINFLFYPIVTQSAGRYICQHIFSCCFYGAMRFILSIKYRRHKNLEGKTPGQIKKTSIVQDRLHLSEKYANLVKLYANSFVSESETLTRCQSKSLYQRTLSTFSTIVPYFPF